METCPECNEECNVIPLDSSFDYAGTHCTGGKSGIHYPSDHGTPVSDCCETPIEGYEFEEPDPEPQEDHWENERLQFETEVKW